MPLLEHAGADALLDVLAAAALEHDRLDPFALEQPRERQPRRAGADDPDLRPRSLVVEHALGDRERAVRGGDAAVDRALEQHLLDLVRA